MKYNHLRVFHQLLQFVSLAHHTWSGKMAQWKELCELLLSHRAVRFDHEQSMLRL